MMGVSRGGMMTYMAAREDSRIKKAVVISGVSDAFMSYDERIDMQQVYKELVGETPESNPEEYTKRSATYWADEIKCPILIIHSKLDKKVSFEQAEKMTKVLEEAGKEYKFISMKMMYMDFIRKIFLLLWSGVSNYRNIKFR
ncbi:MAG: prolyl oligopeptidase family serine peptidase [Lachnospiraceae bacterium]|nr:prolyl oligopeptidase family serine peptidase [Lachnospiraceae bacterium]